MNTPAEQGTSDHGWVDRAAGDLSVEPPAGITPASWRTLQQELLTHADASIDADHVVTVPVEHAHRLAEILGRPWPAGRWPWRWSRSARAARDRAAQLHETYLALLTAEGPTPAEVAGVLAELRSSGFVRSLLGAQEEAVTSLVRMQGGGNFSVPGSGKTTMTYAVYAALRHRGIVDRMLVVAPQSAYESWNEEASSCFDPFRKPSVEIAPKVPRRATEVLVVNYERGAQSATRAAIDGWSRGRRMMVVFDEAHRVKRGRSGEHGRGALDLASLAERRLILTGTPMPNGIDDLEAMMELAWPGHGRALSSRVTPGASNAWVRVTKDQLQLVPAELSVVPVHLDENHRRIYDAVASGLAATLDDLGVDPRFLAAATARLVAAASNPALLLSSRDRSLGWTETLPSGELGLSALITDLVNVVRPSKLLTAAAMAHEHANQGEKLLVWTNFLGNVDELARLLEPLNPAVITGEIPRDDRSARTDRVRQLEKFRRDSTCAVLIATPQTLGEGVSLHRTCQSQVHVDRTFNAGQYLQSLDRTHRVGMPPETTARVALLVAEDTIDDAVHGSLNRKLTQMEDQLRDPTLRRLTQPEETTVHVGPEDIATLIAHLRR